MYVHIFMCFFISLKVFFVGCSYIILTLSLRLCNTCLFVTSCHSFKKNSHSSSEWIYKSPYTAFPCQVALQWSKDLPQLLKVLVHPNCVNGNASIKRIKSFPLICKQSCKVHSNSPKQKKHLQLATTFPIHFPKEKTSKTSERWPKMKITSQMATRCNKYIIISKNMGVTFWGGEPLTGLWGHKYVFKTHLTSLGWKNTPQLSGFALLRCRVKRRTLLNIGVIKRTWSRKPATISR